MAMRQVLAALGVFLTLSLAGCGGRTVVESDLGIRGAPDWVNAGTNVLKTKDGRLFHGVGSAGVMGDESLQVSTADNRARAELARILSSYMDVVSSDYRAAANARGEPVSEQSVSEQISNLTKVNLTGARVIGRWRDKKRNMIYSIAELDMKHVKDTLRSVEEMNQGLRDFVNQRGETIFDRMSTQRGN